MKVRLTILAALVPLVSACSSGTGVPSIDSTDSDLKTAVAAMFESRCASCHGASAPSAGLTLDGGNLERSLVGVWSYLNDEYQLVSPGAPERSFLMKVLRGRANIRGRHAPGSGAVLSGSETDLVARWITSLADTSTQAP